MQPVLLTDTEMETVKGGNSFFHIFLHWMWDGTTVEAPGVPWGDYYGSCHA